MTAEKDHGFIGGELHRAVIEMVKAYLEKKGWEIKTNNAMFKGLSDGSKYPDVIAETRESVVHKDGRRLKQRYRIIVEIESKDRPAEMILRERYYVDTVPAKADCFYVIPLWKLSDKEKDSVSAIKKLIRETLP